MALTNYYAIKPQLKPVVGQNDTQGNQLTTLAVNAYGGWAPGEYCIAIFCSEGTADPSGVTSNGIAFTKAFNGANGQSIWYALNNTVNTFTVVAPTATYAVATRIFGSAFFVKNASAISVGAGSAVAAVALGTNIACGTVAAGASVQGLVVACQALKKSTASVFALKASISTPASTGGLQLTGSEIIGASGVLGVAYFIAASHNEEIDNTVTFDFKTRDTGAAGTAIASSVLFYFTGIQVALDDFTYKVDSGGVLLNNPSSVLPIYDVDTVDGIENIEVVNSSDAIDGADGSYVEGKYVQGKTINLSGTIYSTSPFDEGLIDSIKTSLAPTDPLQTLFFKQPNKNPRQLQNCVPVSLKVSLDRSRTLSQAPFQIQCLSSDAYFSDLDNQPISFLNQQTVTPGGNREVYPVIYFNVLVSDTVGTFTFWNNTWIAKYASSGLLSPGNAFAVANSVRITNLTTQGLYKLDFKNRILYQLTETGQVDVSSFITTRNWWTLLPNVGNDLSFTRSFGNDLFLLTYKNTWY